MFQLDTLSHGLLIQNLKTVEILDLAFSQQQKVKFPKTPTHHYFYKNILMRKVRRIRDLLGLAQTYSNDDILRNIVYQNSDGKLINEEEKMQYLIDWKEIEELYLTERTEYIPRSNLVYDIDYYLKHSSDPVQAIGCCLKAVNKMHLCRDLTFFEKQNYYFYFLSKFFQICKEKKNPNFTLHAVKILKSFCNCGILQRRMILYPFIELSLLIRVTQLERFNFASLWQEDDDAFILNWTLLHGDLKDFNLLLICGSPNSYNDELHHDFHTAVKELFEVNLGGNLPNNDIWEEQMKKFFENTSFLALQVLWLYLNFDNINQQTNSLVLLWKSIPDPFLTADAFFVEKCCDELYPIIEICYNWYCNCLISEDEYSSPRSLQHLALCSIRRSLTRNFAVPSDESFNMKTLGLPRNLQEKVKLGVNVFLPEII